MRERLDLALAWVGRSLVSYSAKTTLTKARALAFNGRKPPDSTVVLVAMAQARAEAASGNVPQTGGNPGASTQAWNLPFRRGGL